MRKPYVAMALALALAQMHAEDNEKAHSNAITVARTCDLLYTGRPFTNRAVCYLPGTEFTAIVEAYYDKKAKTDALLVKVFKAPQLSEGEISRLAVNELSREQGEGIFLDYSVNGKVEQAYGKGEPMGVSGTPVSTGVQEAYERSLEMLAKEAHLMRAISKKSRP